MSGSKAFFLGSKFKVALAVMGVFAATVGGAFTLGVIGVPGIASIDNTFGDVTNETTVVETDLVVSNPNPVGVSASDASVDYALRMNDIEMARGETRDLAIEPGNSTLELETTMRNDRIPDWWASHLQNGERTTVTVDATVSSGALGRSADVSHETEIETDVIGEFASDEPKPVNADRPLIEDPILWINETDAAWGDVTTEETPIEMDFVVYNPNLEPYVVTRLGYEITMNDVAVGEGATREEYVIPSGSVQTLEATTVIDNGRLDDWWVSHLEEDVHGHQVSELRIDFHAVVELPTGDEVTVPLEELTYEETIETDVFGEGIHDEPDGDDGEAAGNEGADEDGGDVDGGDEKTDTEDGGAGGDEADSNEGDGESGDDLPLAL